MTTGTLERPTAVEDTGRVRLREADLRRYCPNARPEYISILLDGEDRLAAAGILANANRWCAFIANVHVETGGLTVLRENMNYTAKNLLNTFPARYPNTVIGRARAASHAKKGPQFVANHNYGFRLGNRGRNTNDGWDYRGALLLQATGREQAIWLQEKTGVPYADEPEHFDRIDQNALRIAILTWTDKVGNLNEYADRGTFRACCNGINRGNPRSNYNPIGWDDRQAAHRRAQAIWGQSVAIDPPPAPDSFSEGDKSPEIANIQRRLKELGYHSVGKIDERFGDNTDTAVRNFQKVNGLEVDGKVGPKTRSVLFGETALPKPLSEERATATAADIPESKTIKYSIWGRLSSIGLGVGGTGMGALEVLKEVNKTTSDVKGTVVPLVKSFSDLWAMWPLGLIIIALVLYEIFGKLIAERVRKHQTGEDTSK